MGGGLVGLPWAVWCIVLVAPMHLHPGLFWISAVVGGLLGYIAARIRLSNSPLQGRRWVPALGTAAGLIAGVVVSVALALGWTVFNYSVGGQAGWELLGPTMLILLLLFLGFAVRR